jgi:hypothetical protein
MLSRQRKPQQTNAYSIVGLRAVKPRLRFAGGGTIARASEQALQRQRGGDRNAGDETQPA